MRRKRRYRDIESLTCVGVDGQEEYLVAGAREEMRSAQSKVLNNVGDGGDALLGRGVGGHRAQDRVGITRRAGRQ